MTENGPVSTGDLFFFYGLLKRGAAGMPSHIDLEGGGDFLESACVHGQMHDLGGYPGLVAGDRLCHGLLYKLDDTKLAGPLDAFEDVVPGDPSASLYLRRQTPVLALDGHPTGLTAWVYWYNRPVAGHPVIEDGNWPLDRTLAPQAKEA